MYLIGGSYASKPYLFMQLNETFSAKRLLSNKVYYIKYIFIKFCYNFHSVTDVVLVDWHKFGYFISLQ